MSLYFPRRISSSLALSAAVFAALPLSHSLNASSCCGGGSEDAPPYIRGIVDDRVKKIHIKNNNPVEVIVDVGGNWITVPASSEGDYVINPDGEGPGVLPGEKVPLTLRNKSNGEPFDEGDSNVEVSPEENQKFCPMPSTSSGPETGETKNLDKDNPHDNISFPGEPPSETDNYENDRPNGEGGQESSFAGIITKGGQGSVYGNVASGNSGTIVGGNGLYGNPGRIVGGVSPSSGNEQIITITSPRVGRGGAGVKGGSTRYSHVLPSALLPTTVPLRFSVTFSLGPSTVPGYESGYITSKSGLDFNPFNLSHYVIRPGGHGFSYVHNITTSPTTEIYLKITQGSDSSSGTLGYAKIIKSISPEKVTFSFYESDQNPGSSDPPAVKQELTSLSVPSDPIYAGYLSGYEIKYYENGVLLSRRNYWTSAAIPATPSLTGKFRTEDFIEGYSGESKVETWTSVRASTSSTERTVTMIQEYKSGSSVTARYAKETKYNLFPWGEEVIREVEDPTSVNPSGANLWTDYYYWQSPTVSESSPCYGKPKLVISRDGSWEAAYWSRSGERLDEYVLTPWKNSAPPSSSASVSTMSSHRSTCASRLTSYHSNYTTDSYEYIQSNIVARSTDYGTGSTLYKNVLNDYIDASNFHRTVTKYINGPSTDARLFKPQDSYRLKKNTTDENTPANITSHIVYRYWSGHWDYDHPNDHGLDLLMIGSYSPVPYYNLEIIDMFFDPEHLPCRMERVVKEKQTGRLRRTESYIVTGWNVSVQDDYNEDPATAMDLINRKLFTYHENESEPYTEPYDHLTFVTHLDGRTQIQVKNDNYIHFTNLNGQDSWVFTDAFNRQIESRMAGFPSFSYPGTLPKSSGITIPSTPWVVTTTSYASLGSTETGQKASAMTKAHADAGNAPGAAVTFWQRASQQHLDGAKRIVYEKDPLNTENQWVYAFDVGATGISTVERKIPGIVATQTLETYYRDGTLNSITGSAQVPKYFKSEVESGIVYEYEANTPAFSNSDGYTKTRKDRLSRESTVYTPYSATTAGVLSGWFLHAASYDDEGDLARWSYPTASGSSGHRLRVASWVTDGSIQKRRTQYATSADTSLDSSDTDQSTVDTWREKDGSGLWWSVTARYTGSGTAAGNLADTTRVFLGPMNLGQGYSHIKRTAFGTTEEAIASFSLSTEWTQFRHMRNGTRVYGFDSYQGLPFIHAPLNVNPSKLAAFSPMREALHEVSSEDIHWTTRTVSAGTGLVIGRVGAGVNETYTYYTGNDFRAGLIWYVQPQATGAGRIHYDYDYAGRNIREWGNGTTPAVYEYDTLGRMTKMHTMRSVPSGVTNPDTNPGTWTPTISAAWDTTTWAYPNFLNLVLSKEYEERFGGDTQRTVAYEYHPNGLLKKRTWQRGVTTTYSYNNLDQLTSVDYSDSTPDVTSITYNAAGFPASWIDAGGTWTLTHRADGFRLSESSTSGRSASWTMDSYGRRYQLASQAHASAVASSPYYHYDSYGRVSSINNYTAGTYRTVVNNYVAGTAKYSSRQFQTAFTDRMLESRGYDAATGQVTSDNYTSYPYTLATFNPVWNNGRLEKITRENATRWNYEYDSRNQVSRGYKDFTTSPNQVLAGTQTEYGYDLAGNRTNWKEGGGSTLGSGLRTHTYGGSGGGTPGTSADALNRYAQVARPQEFDVTGERATGSTAILVNSVTPTYQQDVSTGLYYRRAVAHTATRYTAATVTAGGSPVASWNQYIAPAAEALTYDADGNMLTDGRWTYTWDGENRLIAMEHAGQNVSPLVNAMRLEFVYDGLSRRIEKKVWSRPAATGGAWIDAQLQYWELYAYEGWNLVATARRNASGSSVSLHQGYIWGPDMASRPFGASDWQAAGGVGGLSEVRIGSSNHYWPVQDFRGQIHGYAHSSNYSVSSLAASYDFDPFGREIRATGALATSFPFRYSSKFTDLETGMLYYGYRYYNPVDGRWHGRDPIGEAGGRNLYRMVRNDPANYFDYLGLEVIPVPPSTALSPSGARAMREVARALGETGLGVAGAAALQQGNRGALPTRPNRRELDDLRRKLDREYGVDPQSVENWIENGATDQEKRDRYNKARRCNQKHRDYKAPEKRAQKLMKKVKDLRQACQKNLNKDICAALKAARDHFQNSINGRNDYINDGCDNVMWNSLGTTANHQTPINFTNAAIQKIDDQLKECERLRNKGRLP